MKWFLKNIYPIGSIIITIVCFLLIIMLKLYWMFSFFGILIIMSIFLQKKYKDFNEVTLPVYMVFCVIILLVLSILTKILY